MRNCIGIIMTNKNLAKFFFWFLILANTISNNFLLSEDIFTEIDSKLSIIYSLNFPITTFTLIALFCLSYSPDTLKDKTYKIIASLYLLCSLHNMLTPVLIYWEQSTNLTIDIIIFLLTDFIIFNIIWRNNNEHNKHNRTT